MKKTIICGIASLAMATAPVFSAFAEPPQAGSSTSGNMIGTHDVMVGEVDETVYSVDISWGDMTFDWKYDSETNKFNFKAHSVCQGVLYDEDEPKWIEAQNEGALYSDYDCSVLQTEPLINGNYYYVLVDATGGLIDVSDYSVNGKVKVAASFMPEDKYNWVIGKFGKSIDNSYVEFTDGIFLLDGYYYDYDDSGYSTVIGRFFSGYLSLEKDEQVLVPTNSVSADDKIGTVTITISPDYD